jgi:chromosome segregation ATPase
MNEVEFSALQESDAYKRWWELHLRYAKGESLTPDENRQYLEFRRQLDDEEARELSVLMPTAQFQEQLQEAEARLRQLQQKRRTLSARIATLERKHGTSSARIRSATV